MAGTISGAFSWYNIASTPWIVKAAFYCGLMFAMTAIVTAGVHSAGLYRLGCHPDWSAKLRETLGELDANRPGGWKPSIMQPIIWQIPGLMLKLGIGSFLIGLAILVWDAARANGMRWSSDDTKV